MEAASAELDFERAARFRDQLRAVQDIVEGQNIAMKVKGEQDAIAFAADKDQACVQVFNYPLTVSSSAVKVLR